MAWMVGRVDGGLGRDAFGHVGGRWRGLFAAAAASLKGLPADTLKAFAAIPPTLGFESISACANVTAALLAHGYSAADTRKIMGENWLNLYQTVWK